MSIYTLPQDSGINFTEGPHQIFVYLQSQIPMFIPSILLALFVIIWITGSYLQRKQSGRMDHAMWFMIAGYVTSMVSISLLLVRGLVSLEIIIVTIAVAFVGAIWFFLSKDS